MTKKCRYNKECKHYQKNGYNCNSSKNVYFCGRFRDLRFAEINKDYNKYYNHKPIN